jgi:hypothetical protein
VVVGSGLCMKYSLRRVTPMAERYWITGVQLGLLVSKGIDHEKLADEITDKQFIGNFELDKDKERFEKQIRKIR